ncbi:tetratricopeptide repeat protein [Oscillatoria sp. FACHB-1406]|uniref:tetratricopeptide repeat protein n=1 Tax=Oscillatoria sp. FACHB-1406 TaxID=2692846 RepID=UPI001683BAB4|nr:tetratricopeptide repeat protein [Oscillatoria sp. FACHB-1406]MBD2577563.1 tetratricopeptide repeat protein [Oscillatoria sp. FACHB-1406]
MKFNLPIAALFLLILTVPSSPALSRRYTPLERASYFALNNSDLNDERLWRSAIRNNPNDAEAYHQLGRILENENQWDEASEAYRKAIALSADLNPVQVYKSLGDLLVKEDRLKEAVATFQRGVEEENAKAKPSEIESSAYFRLGLALEANHRNEEAIDAYKKAIALNPEEDAIYNFLVEILVEQNRQSEALEIYIKKFGDPAAAYNELGKALVIHNQLEAARIAYLKALEGEQSWEILPEALADYRLGSALEAGDRWEDAIAAYKRSIEIDPKFGGLYGLYQDVGRVLVKQNRLDDAFVSFGGSLKNPRQRENATAYALLGQTLVAQNQGDEAIKVCRQALDIESSNREVYLCLGQAAVKQNRLDEAIYAYQKAVEIDPRFEFNYYDLGNALQRQNRLDEAIAAYRQALGLAPENSFFSDALAEALVQQKSLDAAFEVYAKTARNNSDAYQQFGSTLLRQNMLEEAISACRQAIALRADNSGAYDCLGDALLKQNKPVEAAEAYQRAIALIPQSAFKYSRLGNALIRRGSLENAIAVYRKNPEWLPQLAFSFSRYVRLGDALMAQNRTEEAIASYHKAIAGYPIQASAYQGLGIALFKQNQLGGALAAFKNATAIDPNLPESLSYINKIEEQLMSGENVR